MPRLNVALEETWRDPERRTISTPSDCAWRKYVRSAQALAGKNVGHPVDRAASGDDKRKNERRLPRLVLVRKLVR